MKNELKKIAERVSRKNPINVLQSESGKEELHKEIIEALKEIIKIGENIDNKYQSQISTVCRFLEEAKKEYEKENFPKFRVGVIEALNVLWAIIKSLEPEKVCSK